MFAFFGNLPVTRFFAYYVFTAFLILPSTDLPVSF